MIQRVVRVSFVAFLVAFPAVALAWTQKAPFKTRVHDHALHDVELSADDCTLTYKLFFSAPADGYTSRAENRNYYLFRTRIKFQSGKRITPPIFGNAAPGERVYERSYDTSGEGCWAKQEQKLMGVDIEACRSRGCTPDPLP
ncbi:MAG TPA: hypothetical protein VF103_19460 [Polyangiaceae bacterium]